VTIQGSNKFNTVTAGIEEKADLVFQVNPILEFGQIQIFLIVILLITLKTALDK